MKLSRVITALLLFLSGSDLAAQDSIVFIIRVDDILSRNVSLLPRSIHDFGDAVLQKGARVSWAVIPHRLVEPQNSDSVLARELRETIADGHDIVLHGYNHICPICGSSGHEMYCAAQNLPVPYSSQKDSLIKGISLLESLNITTQTFVPPGHAQDTSTFSVLTELGFPFLSSKGVTNSFIYEDLFNLSAHSEFTWQLNAASYTSQLQAALSDIRTKGAAGGYYCLLLHDPFIRQGYENGIVINWVNELLDSLNLEYGSRIKYKSLTDAAEQFKLRQTAGSSELIAGKSSFEMKGNYPNPFNPSTVIEFSIPQEMFINAEVFDFTGRRVTTLLNRMMSPGIHRLTFDAREMTSGVYICRITGAGFNHAIKMLYLK